VPGRPRAGAAIANRRRGVPERAAEQFALGLLDLATGPDGTVIRILYISDFGRSIDE
jgi:hypothetical protein